MAVIANAVLMTTSEDSLTEAKPACLPDDGAEHCCLREFLEDIKSRAYVK